MATSNGANLGFETTLWQAADKLRNNMDAAEYKHVVLGLIFLKYISDAFEERHRQLQADTKSGADPEDRDEYVADNIFWVPKQARWSYLKDNAKQPSIGRLTKAFALAVTHEEVMGLRDDVGFFRAVRAALAKSGGGGGGASDDNMEHAIRQLVSRAVAAGGVIDIFAAAGLKNPNIGILSDEFLAEVQGMPQRNLAVELLQRLLKDQIKLRQKKNVVQARSFAEMLEKSLRAYQNRALETVQIIQELIDLAKDIRAADERGEKLGLNQDEVAFYDALGANDSAVQVLGEPTLQTIARELVEAVKRNVSIDWTQKESVRAKLRVIVKRILRRYGYPPDKQEAAADLVLQQAEVLSEAWAEN